MPNVVFDRPRANRALLVYLGLLLVLGLAALMSASAPAGFAKFNDSFFYVKHQLLYGLLPGLVLFLIFAKLDYKKWKKLSWVIYGFSLLLLVLVFIPGIGIVINGSRSWINIFGFSFQPAELAKLSVIIMLANLLTEKPRDWEDWKASLLPILSIIAPAVLLVLLQPDLGTLSVMVAAIFVILFLSAIPNKYLLILGCAGVVCFVGLIIAAPYRTARLTTFLHPELDPKGIGYQMNQAFLAVGSGGPWGLGFGHSRQKFQYLPEVSADSIFAVIAEENGFFISAGFIVLIMLFTWRGLKIAKYSIDEFGYLLGSGIMVWLLWQSFLNIGAMVGALPLTGVPLPFISHGGSALLCALSGVGIVANISKTSRQL